MKDTDRGRITYYFRPTAEDLSEAVRRSFVGKHKTTYGKPPDDERLNFEVDGDYVERRGGPERVSRLITLRKGRPDETRVKAFVAPFTLRGNERSHEELERRYPSLPNGMDDERATFHIFQRR